ncbi:hypothetical protein L3V64_009905 [Geobacillus stearothermophilus]|nr:hypothetical protein [Geobacillus stearothermophilus]MCK7606627.1 hypothetical protein [Geobacillus stearothermophilus]
MKRFRPRELSLKGKLTILSAGAIFITYFVFTFLQYHIVKQWLLNEEEKTMEQTVAEIETYYAEKRNISWEDVRRRRSFLEKLNERYQLIRVTDEKGNVVVSVSNGAAVSLSPSDMPDRLKMDEHFVNNERFLLLRWMTLSAPLPCSGNSSKMRPMNCARRLPFCKAIFRCCNGGGSTTRRFWKNRLRRR